MRADVVDAVRALSDAAYQRRVWIERRYPHDAFYDDLDMNIHVLYDDCVVLPDPRSRVGTVLVDGTEVPSLERLDAVLSPLIQRLGDSPDAIYLADPAWGAVVEAARTALAAMTTS